MRKLISLFVLASLFGWFAHAQQNAVTGRTYSGFPLSGTSSSLGGGALLAGACSTTTVSVTGATTSMAVQVTPSANPGVGSVWYGYVSSSNTVTVAVCGIVALTPSAVTYNVRVIP